ncbi:MAG: hypothetical protein SGPRY_006657 [Prymnesium sp.]
MALEVAVAGGDLHKYNPYSTFVEYTGAAAVWAALSAGQTQPICPTGQVSQTDDISIMRGHMDAYLAYTYSKRPELIEYNNDPDFFAFITFIVPPSHIRHNLANTYDNAVMIEYFLARADDEVADMPRAACYLTAVVDAARTLMRLMQVGGYNPGLATPQLRLGSFTGLFARYPASVSGYFPGLNTPPYDAAGDLGNNAYLGFALTKVGSAIADSDMITAGSDIAYMAEHQRVMYQCANVPTVMF